MNTDEEQRRDEELERDGYDDRDIGPHTHVLVGTDDGDECEICGWCPEREHDPGDEDLRLAMRSWLDLFAFTCDNARYLGDRMTAVLASEIEHWKRQDKQA